MVRCGYAVVPGETLKTINSKCTRELSKTNDSENPAAFKKLLHSIKYVLDMKNLGLKIKPTGKTNKPWEIMCFEDSDYA